MSSAQFKLDMFEGPLDLLLHLISKHKLNIHDIEISLLLEQYLEYMHQLDHEDLEDAADFPDIYKDRFFAASGRGSCGA